MEHTNVWSVVSGKYDRTRVERERDVEKYKKRTLYIECIMLYKMGCIRQDWKEFLLLVCVVL